MKSNRLILPLLDNKLVFFATHRLHWMREMDIIFVLENGKIVETGTHHELYDKKGCLLSSYSSTERRNGTSEAFSNHISYHI